MDSVSFGSECEFNRDLYKAAIKGDIQPFTDDNQHLDLILTPIKNTILHVHLSSETRKSTLFVREMLEKCPSLLRQVNANGDTPLHVAARHGCFPIVKVLIQYAKTQPQDPESGLEYKQLMIRKSNNEGNSALHEAVVSDYVRVVEILTKEDPEFSHFANNLGETPLFIAAERGCLLSLREILKRCKSAAHEGPHGMTALHVAVKNNHLGITRELLKNKESLTRNRNQNGWTPLHFAAYYVSIANSSPKYTLPLKKKYMHMQIIEEIISQCPDCCQMVDDRGWNVLHFAMTKLTVLQLNSLLENPIIRDLITKKDAKGNTPLHVLAACRPGAYPHIKEKLKASRYHSAVNKQNDSIHDILVDGSPQLQEEIQELSNSDGTGPYRRGIISKSPFWIFHRLPRYEKTKDSELVVVTLIATVTFTAALTMPGGYQSEKGPRQGTAFLSRKAAFQAFVITDATAFVLSLAAVFLHFFASWNLSRFWFYRAHTRFLISSAIVAMVVAFSSGTYAVLSPSLGFAIATCLIGLSFFLVILRIGYVFEKRRRRSMNERSGA
ncbi:ankyrin repeat-containing protein At5g02620-like isoform X2 [Pistacia vera]|uniref:ankyrin repeat-containing protein At5g02620-like isoform X2 n=1 Tax=Pistacia vera TaxID=55513 RepID=UPI0012638F25|nr:ankyrin repeat-containing protein At5g02620-like isoform X2 [Pistacia vera]